MRVHLVPRHEEQERGPILRALLEEALSLAYKPLRQVVEADGLLHDLVLSHQHAVEDVQVAHAQIYERRVEDATKAQQVSQYT